MIFKFCSIVEVKKGNELKLKVNQKSNREKSNKIVKFYDFLEKNHHDLNQSSKRSSTFKKPAEQINRPNFASECIQTQKKTKPEMP